MIPSPASQPGPESSFSGFRTVFYFTGNCLIILFALFVLSLFTASLHAQIAPGKVWDKRLGGNKTDNLSVSIATSDGGYLLAGSSVSDAGADKSQASRGESDYWIVKTSAIGQKQWDKRFGTTVNDYLTTVIETTDGGYLLGGYTNGQADGDKTGHSRGGTDYWVIKINSNGDKEWDKTFGGADEDKLYAIVQASDGGYLLGGISRSEAGGEKSQNSKTEEAGDGDFRNWDDFWVIKISENGVQVWDRTLGGYQPEGFGAMIATADGGYLLGGTYTYYAMGSQYDITNYWMLKTDVNGEQQWTKIFGGDGFDDLSSVIQTPDGGYLLAGSSTTYTSADKTAPGIPTSDYTFDYWIIKVDNTGKKLWDHVYGTSKDDRLQTIIAGKDGGYVLAGYTDGGVEYHKSESSQGANDYWLLKIDEVGAKQWDKRFGGTREDKLSSLLRTSDGEFVLTGSSDSGISGDKSQSTLGETDFWLVKTTPEGTTCSGSGKIAREYWANVAGSAVSTIPVEALADSTRLLSLFEMPTNIADHYGQRIKGYLCVPQTGAYTFYIAADEQAELWLSTDDSVSHREKIAFLTSPTMPREWDKFASQQSQPIALQAGKKYYIEALHKENTGSDHLSVGWQWPDGTLERPIPGERLSPAYSPVVQITTPADSATFPTDFLVDITATGSDEDGFLEKVEFFAGTEKIGEATTQPYHFLWSSQKAGQYEIMAKATDNSGFTKFSHPINIQIENMAGTAKAWDKTYGSTGWERPQTVLPTPDGGYLIGSTSSDGGGDKSETSKGGSDLWIIKINKQGVKEWDKTYGGKNDDWLNTIVPSTDGGYLLVGGSYSGIGEDKTQESRGLSDAWLVKITATGKKQWDKTLGGNDEDGLYSVLSTSDGGYLLGGTSNSSGRGDKSEENRGVRDYWIVKIKADGKKEWDKTLGGTDIEQLAKLEQASDGGYIAAGFSISVAGGDKTSPIKGVWMVKLSKQGKKLWDKSINKPDLASFQRTADGGYVLAGKSGKDIWLLKTDSQAEKQWEQILSGGLTSGRESVFVEAISDGGYVVSSTYRDSYNRNDDYLLIKLNSKGEKLWENMYGGKSPDKLTAFIPTADKGYLLAGYSSSDGTFDRTDKSRGYIDYWVVKVNSAGQKQWDRAFGSLGADYLTHALQAGDGGFLLAGYSASPRAGDKSEESRGDEDIWLIKTYPETIPLPAALKINFGDKGTKTPAGWIKDYGLPFGEKPVADSILSFGWKKGSNHKPIDLTANGRWRPSPSDPLLATLMHMQGNDVKAFRGTPVESYWELAVENGDYQVTVSVGDGYRYTYSDPESHSINVEGTSAIAHFIPQGSNGSLTRFKEATIKVTVEDGLLTIDADGGTNTKINYAIIQPFTSSAAFDRKAILTEKISSQVVKVSPNPFVDQFTIQTTSQGKLQITLYDLQGNIHYQAAHQVEASEVSLRLDFLQLKAGMYLLKLQAQDGVNQILRIIKQQCISCLWSP